MLRRGHFAALIVTGVVAALGAMILIPGGERAAVVEAPSVADISSAETIAAIDALLGPSTEPADEPQVASIFDRPARTTTAPLPAAPAEDDPNLQTAALTSPAVPETDLEGAPVVDPTLRPDSIGSSAVNLRAGPSSDTATVTVLQPGTPVQVGESDGGWVEITLADGSTGWVFSRYLASVMAAAPPETTAAATPKATIKGKGSNEDLEGRTARIDAALNARSRPDGSASRVFRTTPGERVKILDVRGTWLHIQTADGSSGWIEAG